MGSLSSITSVLKSVVGLGKDILAAIAAQKVIEATQQTPAIAQLPSVRAALIEAEKEAAAAKQNAIEAAAKAAEMGGATNDFQGQMFDAATAYEQDYGYLDTFGPPGGTDLSGLSQIVSPGVAAAVPGVTTGPQLIGGIAKVASAMNSRGGLPILAALNPQNIINDFKGKIHSGASAFQGFSSTSASTGMLQDYDYLNTSGPPGSGPSINDIPNIQGVTMPTFDADGIQNGTEMVPVLFGKACNAPILPEQPEQPPAACGPVVAIPTNVMPEAIIKKLTGAATNSLANITDGIKNGKLAPASGIDYTYPTGFEDSAASSGTVAKPAHLS